MEHKVMVVITMTATEYAALAEVVQRALSNQVLTACQVEAMDMFLRVREVIRDEPA